MQKQSFLHGAAILALATAIVKVIGALYKIPLVNILGSTGYNYFLMAYNIYSVLLTISTAGLPVAMSRMVSEARTLGRTRQIRRIYNAALAVFMTIGVLGSSMMLIFAAQLASFMNSPNSVYAIRALAPAVLFVCLMSSFRGYFQGQSNMTPTSVSQVLEALCKLFIGLGAAYYITSLGNSVEVAAGGAIIGVTVGTIVGAFYLWLCFVRNNRQLELTAASDEVLPFGKTVWNLLAIAVPITIGAAGLQIINTIDSKIILGRLIYSVGLSQELADSYSGLYGSAQTLFNLPSAFIVPITISVIPNVTEQLTLKNYTGAKKIEQSAYRITALLALPCGVGLSVLSTPIQQMLYVNYSADELAIAGPLLGILGLAVIFNCLVLLTNAILQAHGKVMIPVITMITGGLVKIAVNYLLVGNPSLGITGAPIGTLVCYFTITALNLVAMGRVMPEKVGLPRLLLKPIAATAAMAVVAYMGYDVLHSFLPNSISCLGAIAAAALVYVIFVLVLRIITYDDCMLLPKGDKIARILKIQPENH